MRDPGHFSKRSSRPIDTQNFFQKDCSEAMNRMWASAVSYIWYRTPSFMPAVPGARRS